MPKRQKEDSLLSFFSTGEKMKKITSMTLAFCMAASSSACAGTNSAAENASETADTLYVNASFYTEDENNPWAEMMAVKEGKIIYIGEQSDETIDSLSDENTQTIDLENAFVTPNLIDGHTHPATVGMTDWHVQMPDYDNVEDILAYISDYLEEHDKEEAPYVYFEYYPSNLFGAAGPDKALLDEICDDRPILVRDFSDHASWVNSKFLELLDLDEAALENDEFVKDENGELTGWIKEFTYQNYLPNMYEAIGYTPPEEPTIEVMSILLDDLKSWGTTAVFDAYIEDEEQVKSVHDMDEQGILNMYYDLSVCLNDYEELDDVIEEIKTYDEKYGTDHVKVDTVKIFYDGTNELGDSALVDGLESDPDDHGYLMMDLEQTIDTIRRCNEAGIDVHFHMVGDLAFRQVCDATEALIDELGELDIQVEVCHCEYVNPEDVARPAELGIFVNWTPHWSGGYFGDAALEYLGQERYDNMYQFNPIIEAGALVTFGSDVYSMSEENRANPYFGMQTAMTRIDIEYPLDTDGGMRQKEEAKLSLENLLKGYTINAAKQLRIDDRTGSLETGKYANFNVYEENLFDVDEEQFQYVVPVQVYFEGNLIAEN
jgi:hypothetical protein